MTLEADIAQAARLNVEHARVEARFLSGPRRFPALALLKASTRSIFGLGVLAVAAGAVVCVVDVVNLVRGWL